MERLTRQRRRGFDVLRPVARRRSSEQAGGEDAPSAVYSGGRLPAFPRRARMRKDRRHGSTGAKPWLWMTRRQAARSLTMESPIKKEAARDTWRAKPNCADRAAGRLPDNPAKSQLHHSKVGDRGEDRHQQNAGHVTQTSGTRSCGTGRVKTLDRDRTWQNLPVRSDPRSTGSDRPLAGTRCPASAGLAGSADTRPRHCAKTGDHSSGHCQSKFYTACSHTRAR